MDITITLRWQELEDVAPEAFDIWNDTPDLGWAEMAWEILDRAGATTYISQIDRTRVELRFLALAAIYRDFCCITWQECFEPNYCKWADSLKIAKSCVNQLVRLESEPNTADVGTTSNTKIKYLVNKARKSVVQKLVRAFGNEAKFFASLWGITVDQRKFVVPQEPILYQTRTGFLGNSSEDRLESSKKILEKFITGYKWVKEGCPPHWDAT